MITIKKSHLALAILAILAFMSTVLFASNPATAGSKNWTYVQVNNIPDSVTTTPEISDHLVVIACPVDSDVTVAPKSAPCTEDRYRYQVDGDGTTLSAGVFTGRYVLFYPTNPTKYAMYLQLLPAPSWGINQPVTSAGVLNTLIDGTLIDTIELTLPDAGAPSTGAVAASKGKQVAANVAISGVPPKFAKASALSEFVRVCAVALSASATADTVQKLSACPKGASLLSVTASTLSSGLWSGSVKLNTPKTAGTVEKWALYVVVPKNADQGFDSQIGDGQFVEVANQAGVGVINDGIDGLRLSLSINTGGGALEKDIPIFVPDNGSDYAVLITKSVSGKDVPVSLVPVDPGQVEVKIPSTLKSGTFEVKVIDINASDTFKLNDKAILDAPIAVLNGK